MNNVVLMIGGNEGNRKKLLNCATEQIEQLIGVIEQKSHIYETEPWGFSAEQNFLNQVLVIQTDKNPTEVLNCCLQIEKNLGRERFSNRYTSRPMDIDILFFNNELIRLPELEIPHPRLHLRKFVLLPLAELMPNFIHPVLKETISTLLKNCPDTLMAKRIEV